MGTQQALFLAEVKVFLTAAWGDVDDPGAFGFTNLVPGDDTVDLAGGLAQCVIDLLACEDIFLMRLRGLSNNRGLGARCSCSCMRTWLAMDISATSAGKPPA